MNKITINESLKLYNSMYKQHHLFNTKLYLWLINNNKNMLYHNCLKNLPYELIREIITFIVSNKKMGQYFKIYDNYIFYKNYNVKPICYNEKCPTCQQIVKKTISKYPKKNVGIGKIISIKHFDITLNSKIIANIIKFSNQNNSQHDYRCMTILCLKNLNKKLYKISYIDWGTNFNEYVVSNQIQLIDANLRKNITNIKFQNFIDCQSPFDNKYYRGIITKIHYKKNKIMGINIIFKQQHFSNTPYKYLICNNVPLYSSKISINKIHTYNNYNIHIKNELTRAFTLYQKNIGITILTCTKDCSCFQLK